MRTAFVGTVPSAFVVLLALLGAGSPSLWAGLVLFALACLAVAALCALILKDVQAWDADGSALPKL